MNSKSHLKLRALTEGAIMVALAFVLSLIKAIELPQGGSISLTMLPLLVYAVRWGTVPGIIVGFVFGVAHMLMDGAVAWGWQSMLLDYLIAFAALGFAGVALAFLSFMRTLLLAHIGKVRYRDGEVVYEIKSIINR